MTGAHPDLLGTALRSIVEEALEPLVDRVAAVEDTQQQILKVVQDAARRARSGSGDLPELCTVRDAAQYWGVNEKTARRWIDAGLLPSVRAGGLVRLRRADLAEMVKRGVQTAGSGPQMDGKVESR